MPNNQKPPDFSPEELAQVQRHGKALLGEPTDFDEAVESHLADHEAHAQKMHAAQTGGGEGLGPSEMDTAAIQQRDAQQQATATQGQAAAAQAQGQQTPVNAPAAPAGPAGTTEPFPAQRGPQPQPGPTAGLPAPGMGTPPPAAPGGPGGSEEEEPGA